MEGSKINEKQTQCILDAFDQAFGSMMSDGLKDALATVLFEDGKNKKTSQEQCDSPIRVFWLNFQFKLGQEAQDALKKKIGDEIVLHQFLDFDDIEKAAYEMLLTIFKGGVITYMNGSLNPGMRSFADSAETVLHYDTDGRCDTAENGAEFRFIGWDFTRKNGKRCR
jgi:hypothetical protein